ncbi:MAG: 16S rRNA (uracil(1498)-N(3))-methyltransferase [Candidatus Aminicenantes bacterium]|nr:16S rRNA (uracil(1498)-N(3))-methyltransferase [Candidatus Aminicenantes bacterium]
MTSNQFFLKRWPEKNRFWLEGEEHHHLSRVARIKAGEKIWLTDGRKRRLLAEVVKVEEEKTWLQTLAIEEEKLKASLQLGFGLTKPQTADFIIQKVTELGVSEIQPLITKRALNISAERLEARLGRWQKIAQAALKQSKGAVLPVIRCPETLEQFLSSELQGLRLYLDEDSQVYLKKILLTEQPDRVILIVGPEGGLAQEEKLKLREKNFQGVSLGQRILKTETAIISALAMISHFWNW